jgi:hypothetical protein
MNHHLVAVGSDLLPVASVISGVEREKVRAVVGNASIVDLYNEEYPRNAH